MAQWVIDEKDIKFKNKIGQGNFGEVHDGEWLGTRVAIKKLYFVDDQLMQKYIEREMETLTQLAHPNIVQFLGLCMGKDICIVMEFVSGGDLRSKLKDNKLNIPWKTRIEVAKQLAGAMAYLHKKGIIHRDLKSHNMLVGEGWRIKVCDFGLARPIEEKGKEEGNSNLLKTIVGTNEWMAPEVMMGMSYDAKCDVFSYAMVLFELITRDKPPARVVRNLFAFDAAGERNAIPKETPEELWQLLVDCAERESDARPDFVGILKRLDTIVDKYEKSGWPEVRGFKGAADSPKADPEPAKKPEPVKTETAKKPVGKTGTGKKTGTKKTGGKTTGTGKKVPVKKTGVKKGETKKTGTGTKKSNGTKKKKKTTAKD